MELKRTPESDNIDWSLPNHQVIGGSIKAPGRPLVRQVQPTDREGTLEVEGGLLACHVPGLRVQLLQRLCGQKQDFSVR
jgi:hypothetical protein